MDNVIPRPAAAPASARAMLTPGDRAPEFVAPTRVNPRFTFGSMGGHWLVLGYVASTASPNMAARAAKVLEAAELFDDVHASLFLVSLDPRDREGERLPDRFPGRRVFWDFDGGIARLTGVLPKDATGDRLPLSEIVPLWLVIDPTLTVRHVLPMQSDLSDLDRMLDIVRALPPAESHMGFALPAPVLILPDVFEPEFCDRLIGLYDAHGGEESGFMRDEGGKTIAVHDKSFKVRQDYVLTDAEVIGQTRQRVLRRVVPQIERVHYFKCTRMERFMVARYGADDGGHFRPHRDNTTLGTAHRRFAVSINLTDTFEGGEVSFPEYGPRGYKAPKGAAVIFSCSLLHAVSKVTSGTRYAFLPFLYDEAAARLREANAAMVPNASGYRASPAPPARPA